MKQNEEKVDLAQPELTENVERQAALEVDALLKAPLKRASILELEASILSRGDKDGTEVEEE